MDTGTRVLITNSRSFDHDSCELVKTAAICKCYSCETSSIAAIRNCTELPVGETDYRGVF